MSFKEMVLKTGGTWLFTYKDKSKFVVNFNEMLFDNYDWYKAMGTLESEVEDVDMFFKETISFKKIK